MWASAKALVVKLIIDLSQESPAIRGQKVLKWNFK